MRYASEDKRLSFKKLKSSQVKFLPNKPTKKIETIKMSRYQRWKKKIARIIETYSTKKGKICIVELLDYEIGKHIKVTLPYRKAIEIIRAHRATFALAGKHILRSKRYSGKTHIMSEE